MMNGHTHLNIMGTRGVPAAHGGFETFAERLALYLVSRGITVAVYCQSDGAVDLDGREDTWRCIHRAHFGTRHGGVLGTMEFDLACVRQVLKQPGCDLVLGYNTAIFNVLQRLKKRQVYMNMDGIEWKRAKWSLPAKLWLLMNELIGANLCDIPIADHPAIGAHVAKRSRTAPVVIPYGADIVGAAQDGPVRDLSLLPGKYFVSIARIEPENSIKEFVRAFTAADTDMDLLVLGRIDPDNAYQQSVLAAGNDRVHFPGAIYDDHIVKSLRFHARAYFHGHQVGGTNPSLVEALGAGNAVIAHDNIFNRWTAGPGQHYFDSVDSCTAHIQTLASDDLALYKSRIAARERHAVEFRWHNVLGQYEALMLGDAAVQIAAE
jgi:glycosyltransferase involved in cell wall biosynthesis